MRFIVKKTTKCGLFELICPFPCRGCGRLGGVLCECCKNDIIMEKMNHCMQCGDAIFTKCSKCASIFSATFAVGYRDELIGSLAEEYKFFGIRSLKGVLVDILDEFLPDMDGDIVIVPLPTIQRHIRERGFDHTYEIAKGLAKKRGWSVEKIIVRGKNTVQVGANDIERRRQALKAYKLEGDIDANKTYLLFDDIWTTGATMNAVGRLLKRNGAKKIVAVVLATSRGREHEEKIIR